MVDEARILRLLRSVSDDVSVLQRESGANTPALARPIRRAVGFRNVLVHEYIRVDDDVVIDDYPGRDAGLPACSRRSLWLLPG